MSNDAHDKLGRFATHGSGSTADDHVRSRQNMGVAAGGSHKAFEAARRGSAEAAATAQTTSRALRNDPKLLKEFNELVKHPAFMGSPVKQGTHTDSDLRHKIARMKQELGQG